MPWCVQCKCYHESTVQRCADVRFQWATFDAWSALHNFRIAYAALMRTLEQNT